MSNQSLMLRVFNRGVSVTNQKITASTILVGSDKSAHLRIEKNNIAGTHFSLSLNDQNEIIMSVMEQQDGKSNTTLNDTLVTSDVVVQSGDSISIESIRIDVERCAEEASDTAHQNDVPKQSSGKLATVSFDSDDGQGAPAIEIVATLGQSTTFVKHVVNPQGGRIKPITYGLFVFGIIFFILSGIGFFQGVENASFNKEALDIWIETSNKPLYDFRPRRINLIFDWMAFGGLAASILCFGAGLARFRNEKETPYFRIGQSKDVDFPFAGIPEESFDLVAPQNNSFVFNLPSTMEGFLTIDDQKTSFAELETQGLVKKVNGALQLNLARRAQIQASKGLATFWITSINRPEKKPLSRLFRYSPAALLFFLGSVFFHIGFLILLFVIPPDPSSLSFDLLGDTGRLSRIDLASVEDPKQELAKGANEEDSGGTGTKMALDEGKMGEEESKRDSGQFAMEKKDADPQLARQKAIQEARDAGVLGFLSSQSGGGFSSLTGTGDFSSGLDDRDIYGGLLGNEVGEMAGGFGYGVQGTGAGGGGTGWGTVGTGSYGTIGHGSGTGSGYGIGSGRGGRKARPPTVNVGRAISQGGLDKNIIRRYVRKQIKRITYCYEKQLIAVPDLKGTVTVAFTIGGNGVVISSRADGIGNKNVEQCIASVIKSIKFPQVPGGGLSKVRYPFILNRQGI